MKSKIIIIIAIGFVFVLSQCKNEDDTYSNSEIVLDNVNASLYFHTVFREAEYAWAVVDSFFKYSTSEPYIEWHHKNNKTFRQLTYSDTAKIHVATVEYFEWEINNLILDGTFTILVDTFNNRYRLSRSTITVNLNDFFINEQHVSGSSKIQCLNVDSITDIYSYNLLNGASIRMKGNNMPILITSTIPDGRYERKAGRDTFEQHDDIWTFWGTMRGMIRESPNLNYTTTVIRDYALIYSMSCDYALDGIAKVTIKDFPDVYYRYECDKIFYETQENIIR